MIGSIGFCIKVELGLREIIAGNLGGMKNRFVITVFFELASLFFL